MKREWKLLFTGLFVMVVLAACGGKDESSGSSGGEVTTNGETLYAQSCASCHGQDLRGGFGPDLSTIGSQYSVEEIKDIIENGKGQMPPGILKGDDALAVAEWLADQK